MKCAEDEEGKFGTAEYDYFRYRAWRAKEALEDISRNDQFTPDVAKLTQRLRSVISDLNNAVAEINAGGLDNIGFFKTDGTFVNNISGHKYEQKQ